MSEELKKVVHQNEIIISLLGRMAFDKKEVKDIVTSKKKIDPEKYVEGYNACDGNHTITELAAVIGVKRPTLSPILQEWEDLGIIFEVERPKGKFYKKLFPI
jgi:ActR/RegA family two-component response regulator